MDHNFLTYKISVSHIVEERSLFLPYYKKTIGSIPISDWCFFLYENCILID